MRLNIRTRLAYDLDAPAPLLLVVEAATVAGQRIVAAQLDLSHTTDLARVPAQDGIGERLWLGAAGRFTLDYRATVDVDRVAADLCGVPAVPLHRLPAEVVQYLMPSRYCPSDEFEAIAAAEFGGLEGGACIAAIRDWVASSFAYVPGSSTGATTALESFARREGVCRDYAHVVVTLARAAHIPARFASVYAPRVSPPDFHAVAQVYLDGAWHLVDATGMSSPGETAIVAVGRDAADVAFLGVFGRAALVEQEVAVEAA